MGCLSGCCFGGLTSRRPLEPDQFYEDISGLGPVRQAVLDGDTTLLRGTWLLEQYRRSRSWSAILTGLTANRQAVLPRHQELPEEAIWPAEELACLVGQRYGRVKIVAVSYPWLSPFHPDPHGRHLATIGKAIEQWYTYFSKEYQWDLAIFLDWCSLPQEPRTGEEEERYLRGMTDVHLWYMSQWTDVWLLSSMEGDLRSLTPYNQRGWPMLERVLSTMWPKLSGSYHADVLDLGLLNPSCTNWELTESTCALRRAPPLDPKTFKQDLATRQFGIEVHRDFVLHKYSELFNSVVGGVRDLYFQDLEWEDGEVEQLSRVMPHCTGLVNLFIDVNHIGDAGAAALADALPRCPHLTSLHLSDNDIGWDGAQALAAAIPRCRQLARLDLSNNCVGDVGAAALARALPRCRQLSALNLDFNEISEKGVKALVSGIPRCRSLAKLSLSGNGIGEQGIALLAQALPRCKQLRQLSVNGCSINDAGAVALSKMLSRCKSLRVLLMRNNLIGDIGANALSNAMPRATGLLQLALEENGIDGKGGQMLQEAWVKSSKKAWKLTLGHGISGGNLIMSHREAGQFTKPRCVTFVPELS